MIQNNFIEELEKLNIKLSNEQLLQLEMYYDLLIEYNKVMNLTGITEKDQVYLKHFYDSMTIIKVVNLEEQETLCDIGTGAGFPGLVLKIVYPNLKVTLLDSLNKRTQFLKLVIEKLGLKDIEVISTRAEEYAINHRNYFDVTTARAVAHLSILLEYAIPMTKNEKYFIAMKGNVDEELKEIDNALTKLKVKVLEVNKFTLPNEDSNRTIIKFEKQQDVLLFPRRNSEIKNKRL